MSLLRTSELFPRTTHSAPVERHHVVRVHGDTGEVAVQSTPLTRGPYWTVYRREAGVWLQVTSRLNAAEWLSWPDDELCCDPVADAPAAVQALLDGTLPPRSIAEVPSTPPDARLPGKPKHSGVHTHTCPNGLCLHPLLHHEIPEPGPRVERCSVLDCPCGRVARVAVGGAAHERTPR